MDLKIDFGIKATTALAIFLIGKFLIKILVRGIRKVMQKQGVDKTLETFICNLVRISLMVVVVIAAIGAIGIQTTSFIAIFGAAGLAVGLALQGSLSNFASGVLIVLFRPYRVGDFIEAAGIAGSVNFVVRPWVKSADYSGIMFEMTEAIKKRFDKEGISFPFPQQDVHLYKQGSN